jgi:DNA-binding SARP family transcriptional activator/TolB-like protein/tetratricopeptide (TPR) repeat protein
MGATVVAGVGSAVESARCRGAASVHIRMLGAMTVSRDGATVALPASRKVRALIAYLALAPNAVPRTQLCELLWDVPNDPRGELRWCLSKVRGILDEPKRRRVDAAGDAVRLDLTDCFVDAAAVAGAMQRGIATHDPEKLRGLIGLFGGDFLEGTDVRSAAFDTWMTAQRRRFRGCHTALLEHMVAQADEKEVFTYLETWLTLAPFDLRVHEMLLDALARRSRLREGEEHLATTAKLFESEGLDHAPLRDVWRAAVARGNATPRAHIVAQPAPLLSNGNGTLMPAPPRRASIAVMPFADRSSTPSVGGGSAGALADDVITRLAKLRSVFVIAQGTVFALHERGIGPEDAGRMLNVDFVVGGAWRSEGDRLSVTVELTETRTARIVWTDVFDHKRGDALIVLDEIGNRIVSSVAAEIETIERNRAILKPPNSLDAWEAYHRGLWHMYRFHRADNDQAQHFFEQAVQLDPTFSRAYAGLSFVHFQNAFQGWAEREAQTARAYDAAGQSLMVDERDPAAHWAMGRALWLRGSHDQSIAELEKTIDLSPNFALGHYTLAFVHSQIGDPGAAIKFSDHSRHLSPFDPLLFAMLGARAMAHVRLGQFDQAADWSLKAAARPNAHEHILGIATYCLALAGRHEEARTHLMTVRKTRPRYGVDDFLKAMQFSPDDAALFRKAAKSTGLE